MAINLTPYIKASVNFDTSLLVSDVVKTVGGVNLGNVIQGELSTIGGLPIAAALEIRSTKGFLVVPRMTPAQITAIETAATNNLTALSPGSVVYDATLDGGNGAFRLRMNTGWTNVFAASGTIIGPTLPTTDNALVRWDGIDGTEIKNSGAILDDFANLSLNRVIADLGDLSNPAYSFIGQLNTGLFTSSTTNLDFAIEGAQALQISGGSAVANYFKLNATMAGLPTTLEAAGTDTNINIRLLPKGTGSILGPDGSAALPAYSFNASQDTGIWSSGSQLLDFSAGGERGFQVAATPLSVNYLTALGGTTAGLPPSLQARGTDDNISIILQPKGNAGVVIGQPIGGTSGGVLVFLDSLGANYLALVTPDSPGNYNLVLPANDGNPGDALATDGSGNLSFQPTGGYLKQVVVLSPSDLLTLDTIPFEVITAAGVNEVLTPSFVTLQYIPGSTPYTPSIDSAFRFFINGKAMSEPTNATGFVDNLTPSIVGTALFWFDDVFELGIVSNQPLVLQNTGGPLTLGDGSLRIVVYYFTTNVLFA